MGEKPTSIVFTCFAASIMTLMVYFLSSFPSFSLLLKYEARVCVILGVDGYYRGRAAIMSGVIPCGKGTVLSLLFAMMNGSARG